MKAIYPGSFDPITKGHLDIISRASKIVDELVIAVLNNHEKSSLFTVEERIGHLKKCTASLENVVVTEFQGLVVDFAKKMDIKILIRGLRAVTDFESEFKMSLINRVLDPEVETLFISTSTKYMYLSSSAVKEIALFGGDITGMVDESMVETIMSKFRFI